MLEMAIVHLPYSLPEFFEKSFADDTMYAFKATPALSASPREVAYAFGKRLSLCGGKSIVG